MATTKYLSAQANCMISSCLEAVGIPHKYQNGTDTFQVKSKNESLTVVVKVIIEKSDVPGTGRVEVLAGEITSPHVPTAMAAFHLITEAAGYGKPLPFNRGDEAPVVYGRSTNRPYGDSPDLVVFRHRLFRRVPNPTPEAMAKMDSVIMTCCRFFHQNNRELCQRIGFEVSDLKTYAQVWATIFWSRARVLNPKGDENERRLYGYLRQRFAEFYKQMVGARSRSVLQDSQSVAIALGVEFICDTDGHHDNMGSVTKKAVTIPVQEDDLEYRERHTELDVTSVTKRRNSARALLDKSLAAMPHENLVAALTEASQSYSVCTDTRREARKRLDAHRNSCSLCTPPKAEVIVLAVASLDTPAINDDRISLDVVKQHSGVDAPSVSEQGQHVAG